MNFSRSTALALSLCVFATVASAAPTPVGTWKGKISVNLGKDATPQMKQQLPMMKAMIEQMSISITFNKDKTYKSTSSSGAAPKGSKPQEESGTWSQSGLTVTINNPKATRGPKSQNATLSKDGKTMTITPPAQGPMEVKVVFTK